ncbi:MAG: metal-dependent transcriptional regulator [Phycisphaerales bacterium]|nr:metal-dependent transcriptional regulator [Phycisphaerales bacterium]
MPTETVENYIKAIYILAGESPTREAAMSRVAQAVGVTTGTATSMVKRLAHAKLAKYERFGGVRLTAAGSRAALDILRRHRLVETFLVRTLKLDWSVVHDEAERLEHAISPLVLDALDRHLGHPTTDPHGDPIPRADGLIAEPDLRPLHACPVGTHARLARTLDQRQEALRFLREAGLEIDSHLTIRAVEPGAETMTLGNSAGRVVVISLHAARSILVHVGASDGHSSRSASTTGLPSPDPRTGRTPRRRGRLGANPQRSPVNADKNRSKRRPRDA